MARAAPHGVTIKDVALRAGVSPMTVSRVVNGEGIVRESTRLAVMEAVQALHYRPNLAARKLVGAQIERLGLIYSNPSAAYLSEFLVGALDECQRAGAELVVVKCESTEEADELAAIARLINSRVTGVILTPPLTEAAVIFDALRAAQISMVAVAAGGARPNRSCVRVDDYAAALEMTDYLLALGHRNIGFIQGPADHTSSAARLAGFRAAMAAHTDATALVAPGEFTLASGLVAAATLLSGPSPPSAIFASNDDMAAAVVSVAHRRGLDVPRDLTVVGFDDTQIAITLWPPLTTVRQPIGAMTAAAISLLLSEIRAGRSGLKIEASEQILPHALIERQSSAAPGRQIWR